MQSLLSLLNGAPYTSLRKKCIDILLRYANDDDAKLACYSLNAAAKLNDQALFPQLVEILLRNNEESGFDINIISGLLQAIHHLMSPNAVEMAATAAQLHQCLNQILSRPGITHPIVEKSLLCLVKLFEENHLTDLDSRTAVALQRCLASPDWAIRDTALQAARSL